MRNEELQYRSFSYIYTLYHKISSFFRLLVKEVSVSLLLALCILHFVSSINDVAGLLVNSLKINFLSSQRVIQVKHARKTIASYEKRFICISTKQK